MGKAVKPRRGGLVGKVTPRLFTPPLVTGPPGKCGCGCAHTVETTLGFDVVDFASDIGIELFPWQRWVLIHGLELLDDGSLRFDTVLLLVARQNGKSLLAQILALWWVYVERIPLTLMTSTNLVYASRTWRGAVDRAESVPCLSAEIPRGKGERGGIRLTNGQESFSIRREPGELVGPEFTVATASRTGGRSLTVHRLLEDELREHLDHAAHAAATNAMNAVPGAQKWLFSNAGDDKSVVLNSLQGACHEALALGDTTEETIFLAEYSADDDADIWDREAWRQANPSLGWMLSEKTLESDARIVERSTDPAVEADYRTEKLCSRVKRLNAAIHPVRWRDCTDPGTLDDVRDRIALCVDVSPDNAHGTLVAAALLDDGRVRVETVAAWTGPTAMRELRRDLPGLLRTVKPRVFGWIPNGPAAAITAELRPANGLLSGVPVQEITAEHTAVCMGLGEQVSAGQIAHSGDPLLDAHVTGAERLRRGEGGWVFSRRGEGHCDAAWACAGAVHLARTLPAPAPPVGRPRVLVAD